VLGEELPDEVLLAGVGQPLMTQMRALNAARAEELYDAYASSTNRVPRPDESHGFAGMEAALGRLQAAQRRLAIVTSKSADTDRHGVSRRRAETVLRRRGHGERHPRPQAFGEPLLLALERLGAAPDRAVYVGDAPVDVAAGKAAGVATVAVLWGVFSPAALARPPDFTVATPAALADLCLDGAPPAGGAPAGTPAVGEGVVSGPTGEVRAVRRARPRRGPPPRGRELRRSIERHATCTTSSTGPRSRRRLRPAAGRAAGLEAEFPALRTPDSPTQRVGGQPLEKFEQWRHLAARCSRWPTPGNADELLAWDARNRRLSRRTASPRQR